MGSTAVQSTKCSRPYRATESVVNGRRKLEDWAFHCESIHDSFKKQVQSRFSVQTRNGSWYWTEVQNKEASCWWILVVLGTFTGFQPSVIAAVDFANSLIGWSVIGQLVAYLNLKNFCFPIFPLACDILVYLPLSFGPVWQQPELEKLGIRSLVVQTVNNSKG